MFPKHVEDDSLNIEDDLVTEEEDEVKIEDGESIGFSDEDEYGPDLVATIEKKRKQMKKDEVVMDVKQRRKKFNPRKVQQKKEKTLKKLKTMKRELDFIKDDK